MLLLRWNGCYSDSLELTDNVRRLRRISVFCKGPCSVCHIRPAPQITLTHAPHNRHHHVKVTVSCALPHRSAQEPCEPNNTQVLKGSAGGGGGCTWCGRGTFHRSRHHCRYRHAHAESFKMKEQGFEQSTFTISR